MMKGKEKGRLTPQMEPHGSQAKVHSGEDAILLTVFDNLSISGIWDEPEFTSATRSKQEN